MTPKKRPYKKFFADRPDVFLLPPIAFKIWMFHYKHEGQKRESWPSRPAICKGCNISLNSLKLWRKWLTDNGWLILLGYRDIQSGEFKVPVYRVTRGTIPEDITNEALSKPTVDQKTAHGKKSTVDQKTAHGADQKMVHGPGPKFGPRSRYSLEVDTKEVEATSPPSKIESRKSIAMLPLGPPNFLDYERDPETRKMEWIAKRGIDRSLTAEEQEQRQYLNKERIKPEDFIITCPR